VAALILKPGREKSLLRRHPWVFSGAVQQVDNEPASGGTLDVLSANGHFLARGFYSPHSQIRSRVWTFDPEEQVGDDFFRRRIHSAVRARDFLTPLLESGEVSGTPIDALRLIHAESDYLPGLVVDRYGDTLVMQCLTAGVEVWRELLADLLLKETGLRNIYERSDADVRELEGLPGRSGVIRGEVSPTITIHENGLKFLVNVATGHKTGFYLDQRINRGHVHTLAQGREVLDCFCYTGGFTVNALAGGARSVLAVDSSSDALSLVHENVALNALPADRLELLEGDVFQVLRKLRDEARSFDMIVLDPPKFAASASQAEKASRGYKDINLLAFKLLRPGGILVTFSCSGVVDAGLFQKIVAGAALDAGAEVQIIEHLAQAPDHLVALNFPEGTYLKGLVCSKVGSSSKS
jgi:23S rRNA (cytosine1962-C5)-methyltransferase